MQASSRLACAEFLVAAHEIRQWPPDHGREVAFAGRSNVGKSSAINVLAARRGLARTSRTPGRTQQIVFFRLDEEARLVDLPGYGYAKVPEALRAHWQHIIERYLGGRESLRGLVSLMDCRRPMTPLDRQLIAWCPPDLDVHVVLTKADKLGRGAARAALDGVRRDLDAMGRAATVQLFSASSRQGCEEGRARVEQWLWPASPAP